MKEKVRRIDVIVYLASLSISSYRFGRNEAPFDFENSATAEYVASKTLSFIENGDIEFEEAHGVFLQTMISHGWKFGPEDFDKRTSPELIPWENLDAKAKELYAFISFLINSAKGFYKELRDDLENEILDQFNDYRIFYRGNSSSLKREM